MLDSLDADMAKVGARGEEMMAAVHGGWQGAKACASLFDMTGTRLSPRCGGAEEKPELRRSGDGMEWEREEEKPARLRRDA